MPGDPSQSQEDPVTVPEAFGHRASARWHEPAAEKHRFGYRRHVVNRKKVLRLYQEEGLSVPTSERPTHERYVASDSWRLIEILAVYQLHMDSQFGSDWCAIDPLLRPPGSMQRPPPPLHL